MESKYINRYKSFCACLDGLKEARFRDIEDSFVLSGTVQKYSLTFDISWKVMKDIIVRYHKKNDFAFGSPREVLKAAYSVNLIDDDVWMDMLEDRNQLTHDYDGSMAADSCSKIIEQYIEIFEKFRDKAEQYVEKI